MLRVLPKYLIFLIDLSYNLSYRWLFLCELYNSFSGPSSVILATVCYLNAIGALASFSIKEAIIGPETETVFFFFWNSIKATPSAFKAGI